MTMDMDFDLIGLKWIGLMLHLVKVVLIKKIINGSYEY